MQHLSLSCVCLSVCLCVQVGDGQRCGGAALHQGVPHIRLHHSGATACYAVLFCSARAISSHAISSHVLSCFLLSSQRRREQQQQEEEEEPGPAVIRLDPIH